MDTDEDGTINPDGIGLRLFYDSDDIPERVEAVINHFDNPNHPDYDPNRLCVDLLPFVRRLFWLCNVKEALGCIPSNFNLSYEEINGMVIVVEEQAKKIAMENRKMRDQQTSSSLRHDVSLEDAAILENLHKTQQKLKR